MGAAGGRGGNATAIGKPTTSTAIAGAGGAEQAAAATGADGTADHPDAVTGRTPSRRAPGGTATVNATITGHGATGTATAVGGNGGTGSTDPIGTLLGNTVTATGGTGGADGGNGGHPGGTGGSGGTGAEGAGQSGGDGRGPPRHVGLRSARARATPSGATRP